MMSRSMLVLFAVLAVASTAAAQSINLLVTELPQGGATLVGSGSGIVTADGAPAPGEDDWDYLDFPVNFLQDFTTFGSINADSDSATGTLANVTTGVSVDIIAIELDNDETSNDDIDFDTSADIVFSAGDEFRFDLTATIPASELPVGGLVLGTFTDPGGASDEEIFGPFTITNVPEPSGLGLAMAGLLLAARRRTRCS